MPIHNDGSYPRGPVGWSFLLTEVAVCSARMRAMNQTSEAPVVGAAAVNVSLTSYGKRISTAWKTIETIGAGIVKPGRLMLWLEDESVVNDPPAPLRRLRARGLEIRHCRDYGPHKKYFPYVTEVLAEQPSRTMITADDDVFYPRTWLAELLAAHRPDQVTAFRARIRTDGPYRTWPMCATTEPSDRVFATGVSGVAYPPGLLHVLHAKGDEFMQICPRADDFWLHYAAIATGRSIRQVRATAADWWPLPSTLTGGLWRHSGVGNDAIAGGSAGAWLPIAQVCNPLPRDASNVEGAAVPAG
jgi:hypothetical protein